MTSMKRVVIVQARMRSTRLPGKILLDLAGRPMLVQQLARLKRCQEVDEIVVATTRLDDDRPVIDLARQADVRWSRGATEDVLGRFLAAAQEAAAEVVVRITADCPLIDPHTTDRVIRELVHQPGECDYASNVVRRTFPRGLDTEALFFDTLARLDRLAVTPIEREHVTIVPRSERASLFLIRNVVDSRDNSDLRWTVDTPDDLNVMRSIYEGLGLSAILASYADTLEFVRQRPELSAVNAAGHTWDPRERLPRLAA